MNRTTSRIFAPVVFLLISLLFISVFLLYTFRPFSNRDRLRLSNGDVSALLQDIDCHENRLAATIAITLPPEWAADAPEKGLLSELRAEYAPTVSYGEVTRFVPIREASLSRIEGENAVFTMSIDEFLTKDLPQSGDADRNFHVRLFPGFCAAGINRRFIGPRPVPGAVFCPGRGSGASFPQKAL